MLVLYNTRRSSTLRREHRTKPQVERPSEKKFRMGGRAVDCDGLAYESARQAQRSRVRTSGEQHRQVR